MTNLSCLSGAALVESFSPSELAVVYAASKIVNRSFNVVSVAGRLDQPLSDTTIYAAIKNLEKAGVFVTTGSATGRGKMKDIVLQISFTIAGRQICGLVYDLMKQSQAVLI